MTHRLSRRGFLAAAAAAGVAWPVSAGSGLALEAPVELRWSDLKPARDTVSEAMTRLGIVQHGELPMSQPDQSDAPVTDKYNGTRVRIPGYVVPLDFSGVGVTEFILVPYVGACIHVPPPPPNQIIFVTTAEPHEFAGLFEPVYVTGKLDTAVTTTELADIGYALAAESIEPYE